MTADAKKTKPQLLAELTGLREQLSALKAEQAGATATGITAGAAAGEVERLFRTLADATPYPLVVVAEGAETVLYANPPYRTLLGIADGADAPPAAFLAQTGSSAFEPANGGGQAGQPAAASELTTRAGERVRVMASSQRLRFLGRPAILTGLFDVTPHVKLEEELRASRRLLQTVFDAMPGRVVVLDRESRYVLVNREVERESGLRSEQIVGKPTVGGPLGAPSEQAAAREVDERVIESGQPVNISGRVLTMPDGSRRIHDLVKVPLRDDHGNIIGVVSASNEVSERKELEEQLRQAQKLEAVAQLAGGIAHEFNNLLQIVLGFTGLAEDVTEESDPRHDYLIAIRRAAEKGAGLVKQLLGFGRKQVIHPEETDVFELVSSLAGLLQASLGERIVLVMKRGDHLRTCLADRGSLEQVIMNLCINARDAMPDGGRLVLRADTVRLDSEFCATHPPTQPGDFVCIEVADNGSGMSADVLERAFQPFFTTKGPQDGSGLGLAMVHGLVEQHGGAVTLTSAEGAGTTVSIYLPVAGAQESKQEARAPEHKGTILVAEDDAAVNRLAADILRREGFAVLTAYSGEEALRLFEDQPESISLVLLDLGMPGKGGREVYQKMHAQRPGLPVLFHSGYRLERQDREFIDGWGLTVLEKPYPPAVLRKEVYDKLDRDPLAQSTRAGEASVSGRN